MPVDKPSWKTPLFAMKLAAILLIGILLLGIYIKTEPKDETGFSPNENTDSSRLTLYDNKLVDLGALDLPKSEFLLLSFWASWCPTCKPELTQLDMFLKKLEPTINIDLEPSEKKTNISKLKVLSVNLNPAHEKAKVLDLWNHLKLNLNPNLNLRLGSERNLLKTYLELFEIEVLPTYLLIKDNKKILVRIDGATNWKLIKNQKIITDYLNQNQ